MSDKSGGKRRGAKRTNLGAVMFSDNDPSGIIKAILNHPLGRGVQRSRSPPETLETYNRNPLFSGAQVGPCVPAGP